MSGDTAGPASKAGSMPKIEGRYTKECRTMLIRSGKKLAMSLVEDRTASDSIHVNSYLPPRLHRQPTAKLALFRRLIPHDVSI